MRQKSGSDNRSVWSAARVAALGLAAVLVGLAGPVSTQNAGIQALLDKVISAHGGMEAWTALKDVTFTLTRVALTPQGDAPGARVSLYRLKRHGKSRVETVTGKGVLVEGFDGQRPWGTLDGRRITDAEALKRAHFQSVNWWYWMGIPFKLRDPGVILRELGMARLQGKPVQVLEVTFQPGVGQTNDRFTYYIDPETHHIRFVEIQLQPGVWPGVGGPAPSWSAWLDYRQIGPFMMHTKRVLYGNPELTEKRAIALFGDFQLNTGLPDSLFRAP